MFCGARGEGVGGVVCVPSRPKEYAGRCYLVYVRVQGGPPLMAGGVGCPIVGFGGEGGGFRKAARGGQPVGLTNSWGGEYF